jgi:hypothetical protein
VRSARQHRGSGPDGCAVLPNSEHGSLPPGDAARSASPGAGKVAPVHVTANRTSGPWHTNGQQCQSNVYWDAAIVGVKPNSCLSSRPRALTRDVRPRARRSRSSQRAARRSPERRGAARRNAGEHLGHPQHILVVSLQRTPVPCRRGRGQDLRLRPHRGFVARPLASPLCSRRAGHCTKQLTHQLTTPEPRRTRAPTPRSLSTSKACAVRLCNRRTRNHARAVRLFRCTSPAGLRRAPVVNPLAYNETPAHPHPKAGAARSTHPFRRTVRKRQTPPRHATPGKHESR